MKINELKASLTFNKKIKEEVEALDQVLVRPQDEV